ncbi:hypothetical protein ABZX12_14785 [Kribbella sp. NPDC003505]|uniref:hypothetical protein n=1 Tax=Kribbella sp. NPDC003505 TaxID=3154448 RepID=UPI0033A58F73
MTSPMTALHIDRPVRVRRAAPARWEWTCLCSPAVWPCTGRAMTWAGAQAAADEHLTTAHPAPATAPATGPLAPVIDLAAYRTTSISGGRVLEFSRPGGDAA